MSRRLTVWLRGIGSLETSIASLASLMVLVVVCTLEQVDLGTFNATDKYFRAFFLWGEVPLVGWQVPVFPAGGSVGLVLILGLTSTMVTRFQYLRKKAGIWLIHIGMILLIFGEFVTGRFQVESQMAIDEGATMNYSEDSRRDELVLVDHSNAEYEEVVSFSGRPLRTGKTLRHERLPFDVKIKRYFPNSRMGRRPPGDVLPPSLADRGVGSSVVVEPLAEFSRDDARNLPAAFVEVREAGRSLGTWLVSSALGAPQTFLSSGRQFSLALRPKRYYLPFSLTLKDFSHDRYAGTDIPRNYSSLVRLVSPARSEDRDVLIYMNNPLRFEGRTFFQSSFGKNDTLSILQVVVNPGWRLPYISTTIVGLGLLLQFLLQLTAFKPRSGVRG